LVGDVLQGREEVPPLERVLLGPEQAGRPHIQQFCLEEQGFPLLERTSQDGIRMQAVPHLGQGELRPGIGEGGRSGVHPETFHLVEGLEHLTGNSLGEVLVLAALSEVGKGEDRQGGFACPRLGW
jgi:hypothetical protein